MKEITLVVTSTAGSTKQSGALELGDLKDYSIHVNFTGTDLAGTLKLQAIGTAAEKANDDWVDISNSSQAITSAASHIWNVSNASYQYVRAVWTYSSGTGNWTVTATMKESTRLGG